MVNEEIIQKLGQILGADRILQDEPMLRHCSFRTGGPADLFLRVGTEEQLTETLSFLKNSGIPVFLLGRGTNILVGDGGYRGAVVTLTPDPAAVAEDMFGHVRVEGNLLKAGAGATLQKAALAARDNGLAGFEFAAGIPGSVGGGVVMNAGAYGGELRDSIRTATLVMEDGTVRKFSAAQLEMGYRTSILKRIDAVVTGAVFELHPGDRDAISERITELAAKRKEKQPLEYPSAGSTFKRPEGYFAGKLIQDAGLRGFSVGDAQVSEKHCGFVINRGGATSAQIRELIEKVQERVYENAGVRLEREVIFLGEF